MSIKVCGIGVISALGVGCKNNFDALMAQKCGIGKNTLFNTSIDVPVGQVQLSNNELKQMLNIPQTEVISRTALLGAVAAREAMQGVNIPKGKRVGFVNSTSVGGMDLSESFYVDFMQNPQAGDLSEIKGHDCASSTNFIINLVGINDFTTTLSTACSSAANAVIMGARMLECRMVDYVLVGGTDALCRFTLNGFNSLMILDSELCRPLDNTRAGLNLGEGAAYILLTKDEDAKALCELKAYANANDAHHQTATSENGEGAYLAMKQALDIAKIQLSDIDYINLHGTGTENNDASEIAAIKRLAINSIIPQCSTTKSYTGHTLAAAGAIEAVYSIMSVMHGALYANLRISLPIIDEENLVMESVKDVDIKNVLSSSFGFGGNCSTLIFSK